MVSDFSTELLVGNELDSIITELAKLRIQVFREYPYLYDGSIEYEQKYLADYAKRKGACCVVAKSAGKIVGASTAMWLHEAGDAFAKPFKGQPEFNKIYYFAESVLLSEYRGKGIGHKFFDKREAHAQKLGAIKTVFCAVDRPANHPLKPKNYQNLEPFWQRRGYQQLPECKAYLEWQDIDRELPGVHALMFWERCCI